MSERIHLSLMDKV